MTLSNIQWVETLPIRTDAESQVAVSGSATGLWTYKGSDGAAATKYSTAGGQAIASSTSGRYIRYKVFLDGNSAQTATPIVKDVPISYSGNVTSQMRSFTFDAADNMTERKVETDSTVTTETRTFNELNELTQNVIGSTTWTYTYDDNGNLTSKSDGTDTWAYVWDTDENRLTEVKLNTVTQVTYEYDSLGRLLKRVEGSLATKFEWDVDWSLVKEVKSGSVSETTEYFAPQAEIHSFKRGSSVYHVHGDGLTSTRMVTDSNGNSVADLVYGAWGDVLDESETVSGDLDLGFVGGLGVRRDQTTGLLYMRNRWYDPDTQRFVSNDPIGHDGGINLFNYPRNPLNQADPTGLLPERLIVRHPLYERRWRRRLEQQALANRRALGAHADSVVRALDIVNRYNPKQRPLSLETDVIIPRGWLDRAFRYALGLQVSLGSTNVCTGTVRIGFENVPEDATEDEKLVNLVATLADESYHVTKGGDSGGFFSPSRAQMNRTLEYWRADISAGSNDAELLRAIDNVLDTGDVWRRRR